MTPTPNLPESVVTELLACPFCGSTTNSAPDSVVQLVANDDEGRYTVQCDNCTATMGYSDTEEGAVEAWNTRSEADATYWREMWRAANARAEGLEADAAVVLQALNDWVVTYAYDFAGKAEVAAANARLDEAGPLHYITRAIESAAKIKKAVSHEA